MSRTYKELLQSMVHGHKFKSTDKILEECNIPLNSYYKATNPNCKQPNGQPYNTPLEWVVPVTKATSNYSLIEEICKDAGGLFIPPEQIETLEKDGEGLVRVLQDFLKFINSIKKK